MTLYGKVIKKGLRLTDYIGDVVGYENGKLRLMFFRRWGVADDDGAYHNNTASFKPDELLLFEELEEEDLNKKGLYIEAEGFTKVMRKVTMEELISLGVKNFGED